jgi:hypothetical protein
MKKITLLLFLGFLSIISFAQITITNADMPSSGDTIRLSETTDIKSNDPMLTGANYSWNYTSLVPDAQRLDTFFTVSSTPFAYQLYFNNNFSYPNHTASYALRGPDISFPQVVDITDVFNFIKNSSSAYDNVGFGSKINNVPSSTQNNPIDREYEFPMNYNDNHISNSEFGMSVPGFGYYGQEMTRTDTVDGWGNLITPYGSFNCLRVKSILHKIDTTYVDQFSFGTTAQRPEEIEYKWLAASEGVPILKIITIAGNVIQIDYQDDFVAVGLEELSEINNVVVFPNPVKDYLTIDFNSTIVGNLKVMLTDVSGKDVVIIFNDKIQVGNNKLVSNLSKYNLSLGLYLLEFSIDGEQYSTQKIMVVE